MDKETIEKSQEGETKWRPSQFEIELIFIPSDHGVLNLHFSN